MTTFAEHHRREENLWKNQFDTTDSSAWYLKKQTPPLGGPYRFCPAVGKDLRPGGLDLIYWAAVQLPPVEGKEKETGIVWYQGKM